jgi:hypothetical protein
VGEALAALHALPLSIVRTEGLPVRTPQQIRDDADRLVDRAEATRSAPASLIARWRRALAADVLWRFESAVVLGGAGAASFLFEDIDDRPTVTGLLEWHGLQVGDPATDLQWLAAAPTAAEDVYSAYAARTVRAPDALVRERARLYAELEFAKWLVHGHEAARPEIVEDAVGLLEALAEGVAGDELVPDDALGLDHAIAVLGRTPESAPPAADTSMHTDAYDPEELSLWVNVDDAQERSDAAPNRPAHDDTSTAPIDIRAFVAREVAAEHPTAPIVGQLSDLESDDVEADAQRSADAALRRWTDSA